MLCCWDSRPKQRLCLTMTTILPRARIGSVVRMAVYVLIIALIVSKFSPGSCYTTPKNHQQKFTHLLPHCAAGAGDHQHNDRNNCRRTLLLGVFGLGVLTATATTTPNPAYASPYCTQGVGDGCNDLAQGNDFIRSLQEKSAANKDRYAKEALDAYYMKNYPDFFNSIGQKLVKKPDGSFLVVSESELDQLRRNNKLELQIPKTMGGQFTDLTQKPILMLRE